MAEKPVESPAMAWLNDAKKAVPGHLRVSTGTDRCDRCIYFRYKAGRQWRGDGECGRHNSPVREDFVCEDYSPAH